MTVTAFIKRYPVLTFYAVVFALSWGGAVLVVGGPGAFPGTEEQVARLQFFAVLAYMAGPSVAGILLTGLVHGRAGLRDLLARMTRWRVSARWYAIALLTTPLLVTAILLALSLVSPAYLPKIIRTDDKASLLVFGIAWGLIGGGFLEELGWTGFAVPALRRRHSALTTGLIVGLLWGAAHFVVTYWASGTATGTFDPAIFLPAVVFYLGALTPYRVLMVWVYDQTESLLVAMLMHAPFSASMIILAPQGLALVSGLIWNLVLAAALWIIVAAVALARGGQLLRQPLRTQAA